MKTINIAKSIGKLALLHARISLLFIFILSVSSSFAQCIVSSLDVTTGQYNSSTITAGNFDPLWRVVNKTGSLFGTPPPVGTNAYVVTPNSSWLGGGTWITDTQYNATTGIITTMASYMTFERSFRLCGDDNITFDLDMRSDGIITDILIDGTSTGLVQATSNWGSGSLWTPTPFSQPLSAGVHTLQVVVADSPFTNGHDPIGLLLNGTITSANFSIINDQDPSCANYQCPRCNDQCYWTVDGNNIYSGRNIFGTLTDDNIRIITNGNNTPDRGVITNGNSTTGGYLGWNNTNPTARVHVDCINGNNPSNIFGQPSDIRFENLEPGSGNILVIDKQGYVYDSHVPLEGHPDGMMAMKQEIRELKSQLADLRRTIASGSATPTLESGNMLYQNVPNPFSRETSIRYKLDKVQQSAAIIIYDLNGRELKTYSVSGNGEGAINISAETLQPGMYLYSLVVDGQEIDTKRMVLSKQ